MSILLLSLFLTNPAPLEMPRAEAYLVREDGRRRLEDRFERLDLWMSRAVVGRWADDEGRIFLLADLDVEPPRGDGSATLTRSDYAGERVKMPRVRANHEIPRMFRTAVELLADTPLTDGKPLRPKQIPRGYAEIAYWQHPTNVSSIVCAYRPEKSEKWSLAVWKLAEGDDIAERTALLEDEFLRKEGPEFEVQSPWFKAQSSKVEVQSLKFRGRGSRRASDSGSPGERELLRADARHSVAAYPEWHVADSEEFTVLDNALSRDLVARVTNAFASVRAQAAAALPTPVDGSNVLCVARIFASRAEYLEALEIDDKTNMLWSGAYWSPARRELVAYLPDRGEAEFLKTVRHETFHQYLSYAASMISVSPWLNEGYAQYFEDSDDASWGEGFDLSDEGLKRMAKSLSAILDMDYDAFYDGSDAARRFKYRLAWSLAVFLEKGARKVRFDPFANVKRDYFANLFETKDMRAATAAAFRDADTLELFVAEWLKFWRER